MNKKTLCLTLILSSTLLACTNINNTRSKYAETTPDYITQEGNIQHAIKDERVVQLWKKSETEFAKGQYENAIKHLNTALTHAGDDAVLWSRGAEMYLTVKENALAENYASKSNSFASINSRALRYRNWLIIKHAREMRGDLLGVRTAQQKVLKYQPPSVQ